MVAIVDRWSNSTRHVSAAAAAPMAKVFFDDDADYFDCNLAEDLTVNITIPSNLIHMRFAYTKCL